MDALHKATEVGCPGCSRRPIQDDPAKVAPDVPLLVGWRLALASAGLFLGPVALAIVGAVRAGTSHEAQLFGAIAGLGLGLVGAVGIARLTRRVSNRQVGPP